MKNLWMCLSIVATLTMTGCATTPSKPLTFDQLGQFSTLPLNAHTFRISFQTRNMSYGTAEEITLLKSAQTTVQNGFQFFKVLDDPSNRTQQPPRKAVVYPTPNYYPYGYRRHGAFFDPFYDMPQVVTLDPTQVAYTIECFKDQKSAPTDAFDARLILQSLGQKYGLSPTGQVLQPQITDVTSTKQ
ncbi:MULTISPECIES: hypothetical protein [Acinetobacter]|uniref:CC0125/CC1285 family lipoprotein n=1 Tax=Acinetobacter TaxID=469 RepID=UPI0025774137|nr:MULTISPECIES: hypothetical protein [Acinetobacter]MDM1248922.1 hypothetical protein [Acinetobacter sp. R933-2]MDM1765245.1 hypothetical protein [Acinetobacter sp. 226-1]MDM1768750.1 hypothetical protein [Acinetobacter sp. 226-4]MDQ9021106.1 hypothetical protein [Acinetobacter sichuanensis]